MNTVQSPSLENKKTPKAMVWSLRPTESFAAQRADPNTIKSRIHSSADTLRLSRGIKREENREWWGGGSMSFA